MKNFFRRKAKISHLILQKLKELSFLASGFSSPNPPVASVLTDIDGNILSIGHTQKTGQNHAEREAYLYWKNPGISHNLYVTLEPCSHFGRTPPCLDLVLEHKPMNVFLGLKDPNPLVSEKGGIVRMQKAGIQVIFDFEIEKIARSFLGGFVNRMQTGYPEFFVKMAVSKDGYYTGKTKERISISSEHSNRITQLFRSKMDAICVGPYTIYQDSPALDFRGVSEITKDIDLQYCTDAFWETLFLASSTSFLWEEKQNLPERHQPYRVFFLTSKYFPRLEFFDKQKRILARDGYSKNLFIVLDELNANMKEKISEITSEPILYFPKENPIEILQEVAKKFQWNRVLLEGGNFFYSIASKLSHLTVVEIQSEKVLGNGTKPNLYLEGHSLVNARVGTDNWKITRR